MNHTGEETLFGLKPMENGGGEQKCSDKLCLDSKGFPTVIKSGDDYYLDLIKNGESLCSQCGKCLRYARKKADQRGESIELAEV